MSIDSKTVMYDEITDFDGIFENTYIFYIFSHISIKYIIILCNIPCRKIKNDYKRNLLAIYIQKIIFDYTTVYTNFY